MQIPSDIRTWLLQYIFLKIEDYEGVWFTIRQICNLHTVIFITNGKGPLCVT